MRVNQDDLGSRVKCEVAARAALLSNRDVVVDRCNFDVAQRKTWIGMLVTVVYQRHSDVYMSR